MTHPLAEDNPLIVAAFRALIRSQGLIALLLMVLALGAFAWSKRGSVSSEPSPRRVLRISFGFLWLLDGVLQAQPAMPVGLPSQVVQPAVSTSPNWVQHLVSPALDMWQRHPLQAGTAAIWIQLALGLLLLICDQGGWSRFAGLVAAAWGLSVWALGEAFGGIFSPGASWLFGAPGAVVFYVVAGVLLALPMRTWSGPRLAKALIAGAGGFLVIAGIVQAWPGRGFWQGAAAGSHPAGGLSVMLEQMSQTSQPGMFANLVAAFAHFESGQGVLVNAVASVVPIVLGLILLALSRNWRPRLARWSLLATVLMCVTVWVAVQDFGFFGGVGTDPNSMPPFVVLVVTGYLAMRASTPVSESNSPVRLARPLTAVAGLAALAIALVGIVPLAVAATSAVADPLLTRAVNGDPNLVNQPAPDFTLVDQNGRTISLHSLRGMVVVLAFLDPVCTTDCPVIAQQMRIANGRLPAGERSQVVLVAVAANPLHHTAAQIRTFNQEQGVASLPNWLFLNGTLPELQSIWRAYGISVQPGVNTAMSVHNDICYIIDGQGVERVILGNNPGETAASASSLAGALTTQLKSIVGTRANSS